MPGNIEESDAHHWAVGQPNAYKDGLPMLTSTFARGPFPHRSTYQPVARSRINGARRVLAITMGGIAAQRRVRLRLDNAR